MKLNRLNRLSWTIFPLLFLITAPVLAGQRAIPLPTVAALLPTGDPLPSNYQGIWNYTLTWRDCETLTVLFTDTGTDTICTDDSVVPTDSSSVEGIDCTGSITSGGYNFHCTGSTALDDTCTANTEYDITATLSGNSMSYVGLFITTFEHCDKAFQASCIRYEYTATRVGTANTECVSPVENATWGYIKSRYR